MKYMLYKEEWIVRNIVRFRCGEAFGVNMIECEYTTTTNDHPPPYSQSFLAVGRSIVRHDDIYEHDLQHQIPPMGDHIKKIICG